MKLRTLAFLAFMYVAAGALTWVSPGQAFAQADPQHMPPVSLPLTGSEIIPCDQNNGYKKCTTQELINAAVAQAINDIVGSPAVFNQIITNSGTAAVPNATFGETPTVGDWLVSVVTIGVSGTPSSGWTSVQVLANCNTAPQLQLLYHQVQMGDGQTYSPITNNQSGVWAIAIVDVGSNWTSWGSLLQSVHTNCASTTTVAVTGNGTQNTGVISIGYVNVPTSGSLSGPPVMTGVTGDLQTSFTNGGGGSAGGIAAAQGLIAASGTTTVTANTTGSGTNVNEAAGFLIFLNPK